MSIKGDLEELDNLDKEIKRLKCQLYEYNKQKKEVEKRVIEFLEHQKSAGLKFENKAIILQKKDCRNKKKKGEKLSDLNDVLRKHGIDDENLLNEILEAQRGHKTTNYSLKMLNR